MPNFNKIRPAVQKLQPIEIFAQKNLKIGLLQLEAEPVERDQPNFGSRKLGVVSNMPAFQKSRVPGVR